MVSKTQRVKSKEFKHVGVRNKPNKRMVGKGQGLPYDLPVYLSVDRHLGDSVKNPSLPTVNELKGWTITVDCFTFEEEVKIKIARNGMLAICLGDEVLKTIKKKKNIVLKDPPLTVPDTTEEDEEWE